MREDLRAGSRSTPSELVVEVGLRSRLVLVGGCPVDRKKMHHRLVCR